MHKPLIITEATAAALSIFSRRRIFGAAMLGRCIVSAAEPQFSRSAMRVLVFTIR